MDFLFAFPSEELALEISNSDLVIKIESILGTTIVPDVMRDAIELRLNNDLDYNSLSNSIEELVESFKSPGLKVHTIPGESIAFFRLDKKRGIRETSTLPLRDGLLKLLDVFERRDNIVPVTDQNDSVFVKKLRDDFGQIHVQLRKVNLDEL